MYWTEIAANDLHADLWELLYVRDRYVDGIKDSTVGEHPDLGLSVVSHYGLEDRIEWFTSRPVPGRIDKETST